MLYHRIKYGSFLSLVIGENQGTVLKPEMACLMQEVLCIYDVVFQ